MDNYIEENLKLVKSKINTACENSNKNPNDIMLLAVTKTIEIDAIKKVINLGVKDLGENKVQEFLNKYEIIGDCVNWHFIGHLQTNKVKYIVDKVSLIHSVDSLKLAQEINKRSQEIGKTTNILVEINICNEPSKFGIDIDDLENFIQHLEKMEFIKVKGIMTVAPFVETSEQNRPVFCKMYKKWIDIKHKNKHNIDMSFLSMGMTNDFNIAIEEGSNIVRIGTAIFGKRDYL